MTGHHLVLCDGPTGDARALQGAYARYLAGCCRQFLAQCDPAGVPAEG